MTNIQNGAAEFKVQCMGRRFESYLKNVILESVYPVGSVYISLTDSRNLNTILGFGTWESLPAGCSIVSPCIAAYVWKRTE